MTNFYESSKAKIMEEYACKLLCESKFNALINNTKNKSDVDLVINELKIDVQFSRNFKKYGDVRIDFASAFLRNENKNTSNKKGIFGKFENEYSCEIQKYGKYFIEGYADLVIYFIFDDNFADELKPDRVIVLSVKAIRKLILEHEEHFCKKIKINDKIKHRISEQHGSAFIPINLENEIIKFLDEESYLYSEGIPDAEKLKCFIEKYLKS